MKLSFHEPEPRERWTPISAYFLFCYFIFLCCETLVLFENEYLDPILRANMFTLFKRIRSERGDLLPNLKSENFVGSQAQDLIILGARLTVFLWVV